MNESWVNQYLDRIQYSGELTGDLKTLQALHQAHLLTVPFEDLDIHLGKPLRLNQQSLLEKVIIANRGGFCYELNHLFGILLREIGFQVEFIAAQVFGEEGPLGDYFDHMALKINDKWLADVGFGGGSFLSPLLIHSKLPQQDQAGAFHIKQFNHGRYQVRWTHTLEDVTKPLYNFDLDAQDISDFEKECHRKQINPHSHFVKNKICTMATHQGRKTLLNDTFTERVYGEKQTTHIPDRVTEREILRKHFNINI